MPIRRANQNDVEAVLAINRSASLAAYRHIYGSAPFPADRVRGRFRRVLVDPAYHVLLAVERGEAAGSIAAQPGELNALYVSPDVWGRGFGILPLSECGTNPP
jgi:GNAT superfamily N-acetyltransferase